ncbi:MAG: hypothetical protein ACE1S7_01965 [Candidatus Tisiphia sp.]
MPGKQFLYHRVLMSSTSMQDQQTIHSYLGNKYPIDFAKVLENYQSDKSMAELATNPQFVQYQQLFDNSIKNTAWNLYLHLISGKQEAASYLSECLRKGYGANKDSFLADLTLAIGAELGDQESIKLVATMSISPQIPDIAKKCLLEIAEHKLGIEGREILWDEIMSRGKAFAYFVEKVTQHSYYQTIQESGAAGIKYWSNFVEPVYYCLSSTDEEVSIAGDSLNQE